MVTPNVSCKMFYKMLCIGTQNMEILKKFGSIDLWDKKKMWVKYLKLGQIW